MKGLPPIVVFAVVLTNWSDGTTATDPISSSLPPRKRQDRRAVARLPIRYENKEYDLQYESLGGRDEPRTEQKPYLVQ